MNITRINLEAIGAFDPLFLDYINEKPQTKPYYDFFPDTLGLLEAAKTRAVGFDAQKRAVLVQVLHNQNSDLELWPAQRHNLELLALPTTATITTGHQLNLAGGPLYFWYKILSTIALCNDTNKAAGQPLLVPIFWMASEDHDIAEINHFYLNGQKHTWLTDQYGPVGRLLTNQIAELFESIGLVDGLDQISKAYQQPTMAGATRALVHSLLGKHGILILDPDVAELKAFFRSVMRADLIDGLAYEQVSEQNIILEKSGYKPQAYIRQSNFFYINQENQRLRLLSDQEHESNNEILPNTIWFDKSMLERMIEQQPENLSPNVLLRPLYQQTILPNVAYVGGPAEIAYWLQLKGLFSSLGLDYPALVARHFCTLISASTAAKFDKTNMDWESIFYDQSRLKALFLTSHGYSFDISGQQSAHAHIYEQMADSASEVDPSLYKFVMAEASRSAAFFNILQNKVKKEYEKQQEIGLNRLLAVKDKCMPGGQLQERRESLLGFLLGSDDLLDNLLEQLNPLDFSMKMVVLPD